MKAMKIQKIQNYNVSFMRSLPKIQSVAHNIMNSDTFLSVATNKPEISVILPIYNAQKYLEKALQSLQKQTFKNWEAICVNDCSKDKSLQILEKFVQKDARIKIINQPVNQGPGIARNTGINMAKGKYVTFLDPDDWLEKNAFEELLIQAQKSDVDFIAYNCTIRNERGQATGAINLSKNLPCKNNDGENVIFTRKDLKKKQFSSLLNVSWNKFFKKEFLDKNNIRFANGCYAEDNPFVIKSILKSQKIGYSNKPLYNYLVHNKSLSHTTSEKAMIMVDLCVSIERAIKECKLDKEMMSIYQDYALKMLQSAYSKLPTNLKQPFKTLCTEKLNDKNFAQKVVDSLTKLDKPSFLDKIFSIKKKDYLGLDKTLMTILGLKITF